MSYPRSFERVYRKIAETMTNNGWVSPNRVKMVSDTESIKLIEDIINCILSEMDRNRSFKISGLIQLSKHRFMNGKSFISCKDLRE